MRSRIDNPRPDDEWKKRKRQPPTQDLPHDGPSHPNPGPIGSQISLHIGRGQWQRAQQLIDQAKIDAERHEKQANPTNFYHLEELGLTEHTIWRLRNAGITTAEQLFDKSDAELREESYIGPETINEILVKLAAKGVKLRSDTPHST